MVVHVDWNADYMFSQLYWLHVPSDSAQQCSHYDHIRLSNIMSSWWKRLKEQKVDQLYFLNMSYKTWNVFLLRFDAVEDQQVVMEGIGHALYLVVTIIRKPPEKFDNFIIYWVSCRWGKYSITCYHYRYHTIPIIRPHQANTVVGNELDFLPFLTPFSALLISHRSEYRLYEE